MQELLDEQVQIFDLEGHHLSRLITLAFVQPAGTLNIAPFLGLLPLARPIVLYVRRACFLVQNAINEACRKQFVGAMHEGGLVLALRVSFPSFTAIFLHIVELLVNEALFPLNVPEHVLALGQADKVGEYLRVFLVELAELGQAHLRLCFALVGALQELVDVVEDQIVLKDAHHVRLLVVNQVIDNF